MSYYEIALEVLQEQAEPLSDALLEVGALSISILDADADTPEEQALFGEPGLEPSQLAWQHSRVIALFDSEQDALINLKEACDQLGWTTLPRYTGKVVEEQDWVRLTQSQFDPIQIGQNIWVVPSWHEAPHKENAIILELDPGLAFGTGSHPTTRLCMEWLEQNLRPQSTVLDYGCGSGILAIVAKKLGAGETIGIDIDESAVYSAEHNAAKNNVEADFYLPDDAPEGQFDLVIANILSNPLKLMAAMLTSRVAATGQLILSGVLERQAEEVMASYAPWMKMSVWRSHEGWVCLYGEKTKH